MGQYSFVINGNMQYVYKSRREGKDQEPMQKNTTPDPGHHMGKGQKQKKTSHIREPRGQPFQTGDHKATITSITERKNKHKKKKKRSTKEAPPLDLSNKSKIEGKDQELI